MNMIITILHNTATGRYHPVFLRENPLPRWTGPARYKSQQHHTIGFDTRDEAIAECERAAAMPSINGRLCIEKDFAWDGDGVPAMVMFFGEVDGKIMPAL